MHSPPPPNSTYPSGLSYFRCYHLGVTSVYCSPLPQELVSQDKGRFVKKEVCLVGWRGRYVGVKNMCPLP